MPLVNGTLTDFSLDPLTINNPTLIFKPSSPSATGLTVLSQKPVEVEPAANGFFEIDLVATELLNPAGVHYTVDLRYRNDKTGLMVTEALPWRVYVPADGGPLGDLLGAPSNPALVYIGTEPPNNPTPGTWWLDPETGDLSEWS